MTSENLEPAATGPRAPERDGEALEMLVGFMATAFDQRHELKGFVTQLHDGASLLTTLPGEIASPAFTAHALIAAVTSRGLLDAEFFALLLKARPKMSARINTIRQRCLSVDEPAGTPAPGVLLRAGRYKLDELVDHGGVASVWRAVDRQTDTPVAIKVLRRDMRDYKLRRWQFIKGANHLAKISHPRVAGVIEPHFREMGLDFCVLEYVHGRSLAEEVRSRRLTTLQEIVGVVLDIGTGLAALHPRIFHGDISPKNIIISENGHATLVDFDLASDVDELPMTRATGLPGTDPYASPEWRIGSDSIDARTDIFSLGMTAVYALYGGSNLPSGLNDSRVVAGLGPFLDRNLTCDTTIKAVLARACAFEPSERYMTVRQFCHDLRQATRPLLRSSPASRPLHSAAEVKTAPMPTQPALAVVPPITALTAPATVTQNPRPALEPIAESRHGPPRTSSSLPTRAPVQLPVAAAPHAQSVSSTDATVALTETAQKRSRLIMVAGGTALAAGLALWGWPSPPRQSPPVSEQAPGRVLEDARGVSTTDLTEQEVARARAAIQDLGLRATDMTRAMLQQIVNDQSRSTQAVDRARLLQAELLLTRALSYQIAARLDPAPQDGKFSIRATQDAQDAEDLLKDLGEGVDPVQLTRLRALQALVQGIPSIASSSADEELIALGRGAPLWQDASRPPLPGVVSSLLRTSARSSLARSVLALALWRGGDGDSARQHLLEIITKTPDHPLATVLLAAVDGTASVPEDSPPGPDVQQPVPPEPGPDGPKKPRRAANTPQTFELMRLKLRDELKKVGKACKKRVYSGDDVDETVTLNLHVSSDGSVTSATPSKDWAGTKLSNCVVAKVKLLQMGPFQGPPRSFDETFSF